MAKGDTITANLIGYLGEATKWGREIWAPSESNGAIPVNLQDQHTRTLDIKFTKPLATTTLAADVNVGDMTITVASTTSCIDGVHLSLTTHTNYPAFANQLGAPVDSVLSLDRPLDTAYPSGTAVYVSTHHMNVDGSSTAQVFRVGPIGVDYGLDITRVLGYIQDGTDMDDALFGGMAALSKGLQLRVNNGAITNLWNVKSNGKIGLLCYDAAYTTKAPAGSFGLRFRNTFAGQNKHGVTIRLGVGDYLEILVQDNLTNLEEFEVMAQGHIITN